MGQLAVITALGAMIIGALILVGTRTRTGEAQAAGDAYTVERLAREAAQVGLEKALRPLTRDVDAWPATLAAAQTRYDLAKTAYGTGFYRVRVNQMTHGSTPTTPDRVWLTSTGYHIGWNPRTETSDTTRVVVQAVYETAIKDIGVPPSMRQAVQTDDDLRIAGNGCISGATHSNGNTSTSGNTFDVLGPGTYVGSYCTGNGNNCTTQGTGSPQYTGGVVRGDSVHIPTVAVPPSGTIHYTAPTGPGNPQANFTLSGTTDPPYPSGNVSPTPAISGGWFGVTGRGTAAQPFVFYVPGNLTISGDVRLIGYTRIYVRGTVTIGGNSTISVTNAALPNVAANMSCSERMNAIRTWAQANLPGGRSTLAIYANGNITMGGNTNVVANLWSNAQFSYSGGGNPNRLIIGGVTAQNNLDLSGNTMIYYTEPDLTVTNPGTSLIGYDGLVLVSYNEYALRP